MKVERIVKFRKQGEVVKLSMYDARNSHDKFFESEAPANDPEKVALLFQAAFSKGLAKPKFKRLGLVDDNDDSWW